MSATGNPLQDRLAAVAARQRPQPAPEPSPASAHEPAPTRRRSPAGEKWDDRYRRATFHIDNQLLDELDAVCQRTGVSKSEAVRTAIRQYLDTNR
ncbi:MAG: ribbon-helix-helix domain-containing protein [Propioniciclava sp.]